MKIINSDNNSLLILNNDKLIIRTLNEYNLLKYQDFKGNRIIVNIGKCEIVETFNEGIFNVKYENFSMQLRNKNEICKRIKANDENYIIELLKNEKKEEFNMEFLMIALKEYYNNLKFTDKEIIVNRFFSVDKNGQAYFLNENNQKQNLCIVATNLKNLNYKTDLGNIIIDYRTLEIIYKVLFLLNPNKSDMVFIRQLPNYILKEL